MTRVLIDSETAAKLRGAADPIQLCDQSGLVLGRFVPERPLDLTPRVSDDELERRALESKRLHMDEVERRLDDLEKSA